MTIPNIPTKNPTQDTAPKTQDKDTVRIENCLEGGATAAEVASEAYRVCRINAILRRDLQQLHASLRNSREAAKKQVVQEDALNEIRQELLPTQKLLDRFRDLLGQRKVKVLEDLRASYFALEATDPDDLEPKKKVKAVAGKQKKVDRPLRKGERKETKLNGTTLFLLHDLDGAIYNARKPVVITEESEEEGEIVGEKMTAEDEAAIEHANFMKYGSSWRPRPIPSSKLVTGNIVTAPIAPSPTLVPGNVVAGMKRKAENSNPFAALKMPRLGDDTRTIGV